MKVTTALDHRKKCWSGRRKEGEEGEREGRERGREGGDGGVKRRVRREQTVTVISGPV